ncbi:uncharacterized protein G2W53_006516 [Senna tora]|uniref:Uncharacterized protein n=1 Tax=Senna tora TaxID=362788 RepID=A0A835CD49_9FABA|nr:uncharacterized protein G2W53_006516 [Senna tora]
MGGATGSSSGDSSSYTGTGHHVCQVSLCVRFSFLSNWRIWKPFTRQVGSLFFLCQGPLFLHFFPPVGVTMKFEANISRMPVDLAVITVFISLGHVCPFDLSCFILSLKRFGQHSTAPFSNVVGQIHLSLCLFRDYHCEHFPHVHVGKGISLLISSQHRLILLKYAVTKVSHSALEEVQNTKRSEMSLEMELVIQDLIMESTFFHFLYSEASVGASMDPSMNPHLSFASKAVFTPMLHAHLRGLSLVSHVSSSQCLCKVSRLIHLNAVMAPTKKASRSSDSYDNNRFASAEAEKSFKELYSQCITFVQPPEFPGVQHLVQEFYAYLGNWNADDEVLVGKKQVKINREVIQKFYELPNLPTTQCEYHRMTNEAVTKEYDDVLKELYEEEYRSMEWKFHGKTNEPTNLDRALLNTEAKC